MRSRTRNKSGPRTRVRSVKELLGGVLPTLTRVTEQAKNQHFYSAWIASRLPAELASHVCAVHEREGTLVVFAKSAAWSARLRYALAELEPALLAEDRRLTGIELRVLPQGSNG